MIEISCCMYSKKCLDELSQSAAFMREIHLLFRLSLPLSSADERKKSITQITVLECFLETFKELGCRFPSESRNSFRNAESCSIRWTGITMSCGQRSAHSPHCRLGVQAIAYFLIYQENKWLQDLLETVTVRLEKPMSRKRVMAESQEAKIMYILVHLQVRIPTRRFSIDNLHVIYICQPSPLGSTVVQCFQQSIQHSDVLLC